MPIPQKDRQRVSASGLHDRHRWRVLAMSIKTVHDSLESGQRKILAADRERWKHMGARWPVAGAIRCAARRR
jgi:hypothetical protein